MSLESHRTSRWQQRARSSTGRFDRPRSHPGDHVAIVHPVLLDFRPAYLERDCQDASFLLAPAGTTRLVSLLCSGLGTGARRPVVLTSFRPTTQYVDELRGSCDIETVAHVSSFHPADNYDASDWLLFVDARWYAPAPLGMTAVLKDTSRSCGQATHLAVTAKQPGGTRERVETSPDGRVRRIRRYY